MAHRWRIYATMRPMNETAHTATFRFHGVLNDFLPHRLRGSALVQRFDWRGSVKDMIEALGVPHTEIELIVANSRSVDFGHIVQDGDQIDVYPAFDAVDLPGRIRLRQPLHDPPNFVLDIHLGRLAAYLRMLGFDTLYNDPRLTPDFPDELLAQIAHDEGRVLLTRDVGLLKRNMVTYGYYVRSASPRAQLVEVAKRFSLAQQARLFTRCLRCNGPLERVPKGAVLDRIPPDAARYYHEFSQCEACGQVYWRGSHVLRMEHLIAEALGPVGGL